MCLFYAAFFVFTGVQLPFWPTWLASRGLSGVEIGLLVSAGVWARSLASPFITRGADRGGERRRLMLVLAWSSAAVFALYAWPGGFWWLLPISIAFSVLYAPLLALAESMTLLTVSGERYGRVRLWGSVTFIAGATAAGHLLQGQSADRVLWLCGASLAGFLVVCHLLPDVRPQGPPAQGAATFGVFLRAPRFLLFLFAAAAVQSSHGAYYGFATLHWQSSGLPEGAIGWLWAEAVLAEICLFALAPQLARRFGSTQLICIGGAAGVLRWAITGATTDAAVLIAVQPLHALTYGATQTGAMLFIAETVDPHSSATAQGLYGGFANGIAMALSLWLAGTLHEAGGGDAFWAMAALAGIGCVAAALLQRKGRARLGAAPPAAERL